MAAAHEPALLDAYVVYGDWLQEKGDPYGDLIAVQVRIVTSGPTRELLRAEADLLRQLKLEGRPWPTWDQASAIARASDTDVRG